jgi:polyisoprenoid-binding protein YceI
VPVKSNYGLRTIYTDGRRLPPQGEPQPYWHGYSVGQWDGDTLVVQSNNFRGAQTGKPGDGWLDLTGHPFTDALTLTERFRRVDFGHLEIDVTIDDPKAASLTIDASSVNTDTPDRDKNLRSDEFFAVETYPTITFQSSRVAKKGADRYDVVGTLTIRGVAKEVLLPVTYVGAAKDPWGKARAGFEASLTVNRRDFGLTWDGPPLEAGGFIVGDDVTISLSIQGIA